jgi:hypothetical protein
MTTTEREAIMYRTLIIAVLAIGMLGQPTSAQNAAPTPNGTFVGQALGTALVTMRDTVTGNAVDAVYSVTGRVTLDVEANVVALKFTDFVLTPPTGFVKPAGYSGPTTSFTIGQFNSEATRTPANYNTLTEPWFSDHGGQNIGPINPVLPGFPAGSGTIEVEGSMAGRLITGSMRIIMSVPPGNPYVVIRTTFIAVPTH